LDQLHDRRVRLAFLGFALVAVYFVWTEHRAHVPWLILAFCPLLHLFMHRGHGGHGGSQP
jgi:hypothetical protein